MKKSFIAHMINKDTEVLLTDPAFRYNEIYVREQYRDWYEGWYYRPSDYIASGSFNTGGVNNI